MHLVHHNHCQKTIIICMSMSCSPTTLFPSPPTHTHTHTHTHADPDSECMVTSCGPSDVRCSLPVDASFECSTCPTGFITGNLSHDVACVGKTSTQ